MKIHNLIYFLAFAAGLCASSGAHQNIPVYGNRQLRASTILDEIYLKPGIALSDSLLRAERLWLLKLDFLKKVEWIKIQKNPSSNPAALLIIREKFRFSITPWADWDDFFGLYADFSFKISNLRGRRDYFKAGASVGAFQEMYASYHLPRWGGPLNLFAEGEVRWSNKEYRYPDHARFDQRIATFHINAGKTLSRIWKAGLSGTLGHFETDNPEITCSGKRYDDWREGGVFIAWDSRDWPIYPRSGAYGILAYRERFYDNSERQPCFMAENRWYLPVKKRDILAFQFKTEILGDGTPVYHRLHYGDSRTVRGIDKGSLSGYNGWFSSIEYRFPVLYIREPEAGLHMGWAGFFFVDAGSASEKREDVFSDPIKVSGGIGGHGILDPWTIHGEIGYAGKDGFFLGLGTSAKF